MKLLLPIGAAVAMLVLLPQNARAPPDDDSPPLDYLQDGGPPPDPEELVFSDPNCTTILESGWVKIHSETSNCRHTLFDSNVELVVKMNGLVETRSYEGVTHEGSSRVEWKGSSSSYEIRDPFGVAVKPVDTTGTAYIEVFSNGKTVITAVSGDAVVTNPRGDSMDVRQGDVVAFFKGYHYYSIVRGARTEYPLPDEAFAQGCHCNGGQGGSSIPPILVAVVVVGWRRRRT